MGGLLPNPTPTPRDNPHVDDVSWQKAVEYAKHTNSDVLFVWHDGKLDRAWSKEGYVTDSLTNTYYLNYFVLVLAYGIALEEGIFESIDISVDYFLPEWEGQERGRITLRNLLQMHSGLELYKDNLDPTHKSTRLFFGSQTTEAALEFDLAQSPGTQFEYNYVVPEILGIILERASGERYANFVSKRIWKPLGNSDAYVWLDGPDGRAHFNAALFADADDWLRIGVLIAQGGLWNGQSIVPTAWIEELSKPSPSNPAYGMVWLAEPYQQTRRLSNNVSYVIETQNPFTIEDLLIFDGYGGQRIYVSPEEQLVIVRIGATARDNWDDSMIPNLIAGGLKQR